MSLFRTLYAVASDIARFFSYKTKPARYRLAALTILLVIGVFFVFRGGADDAAPATPLRTVMVGTVASLDTAQQISLIGTVEAISQANLETEAGGRVTSVAVALGDRVRAGQTIATLENASQYAAVLQAEGAYEGALAAAASSDVSVTQAQSQLSAAENSAASALRGAYTVSSNGFYTLIDGLYGNPESTLPGVRVGSSQTSYLNQERVAFQDILPQWQASVAGAANPANIDSALTLARTNTSRTIGVVDAFIFALNGRDKDTLEGKLIETWISELNALRTSLNASLASLDAAQSTLNSARDTLAQAELGGTGGDVSLANAQVKQALGSLRAAQAAYAKTIVRTPIAGVVNTLELKVGDFVGPNAPAAIIANNQALEITTYVGAEDLATILEGQTVLIEGLYEGRITAIAPAINPATQKVEVKIQTESAEIANGDTVRIALTTDADTVGIDAAPSAPVVDAPLFVPLTAVKFTATDGSMFTVEDGIVTARPVVLGRISGDVVEITEGIDAATVFIIDARGLADGQQVEAVTKN